MIGPLASPMSVDIKFPVVVAGVIE